MRERKVDMYSVVLRIIKEGDSDSDVCGVPL